MQGARRRRRPVRRRALPGGDRRAGRGRAEIAEARIDESVRRLLRDKFRLGLFDDPYVDPDAAEQDRRQRRRFARAGEEAQRRSIVLLAQRRRAARSRGRPRLYVENIEPEVAARLRRGRRRSPDEADAGDPAARTRPTSRARDFLERFFHAGEPGVHAGGAARASSRSRARCRRSWTSTSIARR